MKQTVKIIATIMSFISINASAHDFEVGGIYYVKNSDGTTVSVSYAGPSYNAYTGEYSGSISIPPSVTYSGKTYTVTSIGSGAFRDCIDLTSVTIPNSITSISSAFDGCSGLTTVNWNAKNCADLSYFNLPFYELIGIKTFNFGDEVHHIPAYLCYGLSGLTSVTIPNSVKSIGRCAFLGCSGLTSITIPNSVTEIGDGVFSRCSGLMSIVVETENTMFDSRNNCNAIIKSSENQLIAGCKNTIIPNSVTSIGVGAFTGCSGLTSVTIGNSVTEIGRNAFYDCSGLTSITIPSTVTTIGEGAFYGCSGLKTVNWNAKNCADFSYNLSAYTYPPLYQLTGITSFNFGNEVEHIPSYLCYGLGGLTSVTIPNSVTSIGVGAFTGCSGLKTVNWNAKNCADFTQASNAPFYGLTEINTFNFGDEVQKIPAYLCNGLSNLNSITIPLSVTSISKYAFSDCGVKTVNWNAKNCADFSYNLSTQTYPPFYQLTGITTFNFGNEVEHIPSYLCYSLHDLTLVAIPNSVTSIGVGAFTGCSGLTDVTIGNSVTSIGSSAFYGCNGLTSVTIPNPVTMIGNSAFYGCNSLTSVTITNSVTLIGNSAFYGCKSLTSVTIPESIISIGSSAFQDCSGLKTVNWNAKNCGDILYGYWGEDYTPFYELTKITTFNFGNEVKHIPSYLCYGLSGLTSVTIPNSVTSIGVGAFYGCSGLTSVTIGNSVTEIGRNAFYNCSGLTKVEISDISTWCNIYFNDYVDNPLSYAHHLYLNDSEIKDLVVPNSVNSIGNYTFSNCRGLTSVTIPNSVTSIGVGAFTGCSGLTSVDIPNSVTLIGNSAFYGCNSLTSVTIPNSVTLIGNSAFYGCSGLTSVTIGNSVTEIGRNAFYNCSGLTSVSIPNSVTSIDESAFQNCSGLTSVTIPNSVTLIGNSAFYGCNSLTSVTIPNSVTEIGYSAFSGCKMLQSLIIGSSVNTINNYAFSGCNYLMDVTNYAEIPQVINANVFNNVDLSLCNLYVLENSYKFYIREPVWKDFIVKVAGVEGVEVDEATKEVEGYYDLKGVRLVEPVRGQANIVRYTDGTSKKIIIE